MTLDPRLHPIRQDLAAEALRGIVDAPRYASPLRKRVAVPVAPLRSRPEAGGLAHELIWGAEVDVYDEADGQAWVQAAEDGYVGYVPADALCDPGAPPTHRVAARVAPLHAAPELKTGPIAHLPFNARLSGEIVTEEGSAGGAANRRWLRCAEGSVPAPLVAPLDSPSEDWVAEAEALIGAPYVWGGATPLGLDCSALIQIARRATGLACPRDSDHQQAACAPVQSRPLARGDLVFWSGHVGVMTDADTLLHANAHHMAVASEPLAGAVARIEASGGGAPSGFGRLADA